jgi:hypothetical protein
MRRIMWAWSPGGSLTFGSVSDPQHLRRCRHRTAACTVSGMAHSFTAKSDGSLGCDNPAKRRKVLVTGAAGNIGRTSPSTRTSATTCG